MERPDRCSPTSTSHGRDITTTAPRQRAYRARISPSQSRVESFSRLSARTTTHHRCACAFVPAEFTNHYWTPRHCETIHLQEQHHPQP